MRGSIPRLWIYKITVFAIYSEFYAEKQQKKCLKCEFLGAGRCQKKLKK
jgi:hypothetical protein